MDSLLEDDKEAARLRFVIFRCLWSVATLFHYHWTAYQYSNFTSPEVLFGISSSLLAVSFLIFPTKTILFNLLLVSQLADVLWLSPNVPNHWLLSGCISLTLLLSVLSNSKSDKSSLRLCSAIMLQVAIFYFFTFFWKLNSDFLDPLHSCGVEFFHGIQKQIPILPRFELLDSVVIYSTLAVELLLPILLIVSRTRVFGVLLAVAFHFALGLHLTKFFLNFSSVMYALLFLFLPNAYLIELKKQVSSMKSLALSRVFAVLFSAFIVSCYFYGQDSPVYFIVGREMIWLLYAIFFVTIFISLLKKLGLRNGAAVVSPTLAGLFVVLLVLLNGLAPILGLKTGSSWQMYSNIFISADDSNHLLVPKSLDLFGELSSTATIRESDIAKLIAGGEYQTLEIRRALRQYPEKNIVLDYQGQTLTRKALSTTPPFSKPLSLVERKVFRFHRADLEVSRSCNW